MVVHEVGEVAGWLFIALDYLRGGDLDTFLHSGLPTPRMAAEWIRNLADAIAHAHSRSVVHRDLKPGNLLMNEQGQLLITDFGLARLVDQESNLTFNDEVFGTAEYMAPEQVSRRPYKNLKRADIYSLGAILFHCLAGTPPFHRDNLADLLFAVTHQEARFPPRVADRAGRDLVTICLKCLAKDPARRYRSAESLRADLDRFLRNEPIAARPVDIFEQVYKWAQRRPMLASLTGIFAGILLLSITIVDAERRQAQIDASIARRESSRSRALLTKQLIARGTELETKGDYVGSLPWFLGAWKNDAPIPDSTPDQIHQIRLASTLARAPRLQCAWELDSRAQSIAVSPDGRLVAAGGIAGTIQTWNTHSGALIAKIKESSRPINSLAWSTDGRFLVTGEGEEKGVGQVTIWRVPEFEVVLRISMPGWVRYAEFSNDGNWVVTASGVGDIDVWSVDEGVRACDTLRHQDRVIAVHFSPDGSQLASAGWDGTARVWDWKQGTNRIVARHAEYCRSLAVDSQWKRLATASDDGTAQVWNLSTGAAIGDRLKHRARVYVVSFSPDGKWIATGSNDGTARVWDSTTGHPISPPLQHSQNLRRIAFSPDGHLLLTATLDGGINVWNPETGQKAFSPISCQSSLGVAWLLDNSGFVTAGSEGLAQQWAIPSNTQEYSQFEIPGQPLSMQLSSDGNQLVAAVDSDFGILCHWRNKSLPFIPLKHGGLVGDVGFSPDGSLCFTVSEDGTARVWNSTSGKPVSPPLEHGAPVCCALFCPNGRDLLTGDNQGVLRRWNVDSGQNHGVVGNLPGSIKAIRISADGRLLTALANGHDPNSLSRERAVVGLWNMKSLLPQGHPIFLPGPITAFEFCRDGRLLAMADPAGLVTLLSTAPWPSAPQVLRPQSSARSIQFSRDGTRLLTASANGSVRIWSTTPEMEVMAGMSVIGASKAWFVADDRWILTSGRNGIAQIWDTESANPIFPPFTHDDYIRIAAVTPDRQWLLTGGLDRYLKVWPLSHQRLSLPEAERRVGLISGQMVDSTGVLTPIPTGAYIKLWAAQNAQLEADAQHDANVELAR